MTRFAEEFWSDIGQGSSDMETSGGYWPTPIAADAKGSLGNFRGDGKPKRNLGQISRMRGRPISSAAVSPASLSALQVSEKAAATHDGSGPRCVEFARYSGHDGCWLKTCLGCSQLMLDGSSEKWSETWPRSGIALNGIAYRQQPLVPRISGIGSLLWRTPAASETTGGAAIVEDRMSQGHAVSLSDQVRKWPTPSARDWRSGKASIETMERNARPLNEQVGGTLNPTWVEWLQGFPLGWTEV